MSGHRKKGQKRRLKQQELNKYKTEADTTDNGAADGAAAEVGADRQQVAGEEENGETRGRGMSIGDDFFYSDVVDEEQLFQFLMSDTS